MEKKVLSFENRFRCKNGDYKIFSWKSVPVGQLMYAVARDITSQKKFENELMDARETAQNAAHEKSSFLASMSHEIRTPLNGVVGMIDLLARTPLSPEQKNFVSAIRGSSAILLKTVNEVLDFSKLEAARVHLEKVDFNLSHLVEDRMSLAGVLAHEKGLKLEALVDPRVPQVLHGDPGKIGQVLLNLLNNAIKFTGTGNIFVHVEMNLLSESRCNLKISVRDSGIGIDPQQIARLFKPFSQADNSTSRKYGGTGLGLSICKHFVEIMDGKIGVDSRLGEGATFWFEVPLAISMRTSLPSDGEDADLVAPSNAAQLAERRNFRILIAEDNHMNQAVVMSMMSVLGYSAELAQNGQEAVVAFQRSNFDLILMDQNMPVLDGIQSSIEIRKLEQGTGKRIPIVAFTATVIQDDQKEQFKNFMDDFILKPVTIETLESVISSWERRLQKV